MKLPTFLPLVLIPSCVVAIPAVAMFFAVEGWAWSGSDFIIAWVVVAGAVGAYTFVSRLAPNGTYRAAAALAVFAGVVLLWINGAVGLIGSEDNPANLMYAGVLAIGLAGAALARFKPTGLARALGVTAIAQFLVPIVALLIWRPDFSPGVVQVLLLNFGFVMMFGVSALLFRHAAKAGRGPAAAPAA